MSGFVTGVGLWTATHPSAAAWIAGEAASSPASPSGEGIPPRARRRATPIARMAADALAEALVPTGRTGADVDLLLASVGGELANTLETLRLLGEDPPASSPLRFGASVHNAALGQLAIPWENRRFASALAARDDRIVATGLLEAVGRVATGAGDAAVVFCDEAWPVQGGPAAAVALVISEAPRGDRPPIARLGPVRRAVASDLGVGTADPALEDCPVRDALRLADALLRGVTGVLPLGDADADGLRWTVSVEPA